MVEDEKVPGVIGFHSGDRTILRVSGEGNLTLGPDVTWDEAAAHLLESLEKLTGRKIVSVERARPWVPHTRYEVGETVTIDFKQQAEALIRQVYQTKEYTDIRDGTTRKALIRSAERYRTEDHERELWYVLTGERVPPVHHITDADDFARGGFERELSTPDDAAAGLFCSHPGAVWRRAGDIEQFICAACHRVVEQRPAPPTREEVKAWLRDHTALALDGTLTDQIMRWIARSGVAGG